MHVARPASQAAHAHAHVVQEFRRALVELRAEAARTPPPDDPAPVQGSKKKMPAKLAAKLELLTRPFYLSAEAATSTNRAKKLLWGVLMPVLTTWSAEPTIKTKMQKINSHIIGQYTLTKERFQQIARWHGAPPHLRRSCSASTHCSIHYTPGSLCTHCGIHSRLLVPWTDHERDDGPTPSCPSTAAAAAVAAAVLGVGGRTCVGVATQ